MAESVVEIKKAVAKLISVLHPRNREILSRRFGLKTGKKETLESIGQIHGITRERVRQIEEASVQLIKSKSEFSHVAGPYVRLAQSIIDQTGGVIRETDLFKTFSGSEKSSPVNSSLALILSLDEHLERYLEDEDFYAFWGASAHKVATFKESITSFINFLENDRKVISEDAIASLVSAQTKTEPLDPDTLNSYLSISKKIGKNVFGGVGLTNWTEIKPRGVRDKSYLVLKKEGKPKHFKEIAELINSMNFSPRKAHVQTVHNELIKDPRFVLVGRGMYGLSDWGYKPGTVKDVIADLIRQNGPMSKDEIVAQVLNSRIVKPATVLLGMQDKKLFAHKDNGIVELKTREI